MIWEVGGNLRVKLEKETSQLTCSLLQSFPSASGPPPPPPQEAAKKESAASPKATIPDVGTARLQWERAGGE